MIKFTNPVAFVALLVLLPSAVVGDCPCWTAEELDTVTDTDNGNVNEFCEFYNQNNPGPENMEGGPGWKYGYFIADDSNGDHLDVESFVDSNEDSYCVLIIGSHFVWLDISKPEASNCLAEVQGRCANAGFTAPVGF